MSTDRYEKSILEHEWPSKHNNDLRHGKMENNRIVVATLEVRVE
jgi:hypothetical protein